MDEFPGLLARDFGFRPQGKSAPMTASKGTGSIGSGGTLNFGIGSGGDTRSSSFSSNVGKSGWNSNSNSNPVGGSFLDDHDGIFGSSGNQRTKDFGDLGSYDDVFGGPPKYTNPLDGSSGAPSASSFDYDSIFQGSKSSGAKSSSLPVFDKPVYDDDIFDGVPGLKSSSSVKYEDVFSSISSPPKQNAPFDDLLGNLGRTEPKPKSSSGRPSGEVEKNASSFDDLIPGFGSGSSSNNRVTSETSQAQQSSVPAKKSTSGVIEDPFVVLESTSTPAYASSGLFTESLEQIDKQNTSGSTKVDVSSVRGAFDDMDPLAGFTKSVPLFASDMNNRGKDKIPLPTGPKTTNAHNSTGREPVERPSTKMTENAFPKKMDMSPKSEDNFEAADDEWLTVSEIPLFTQPTSAPPPSRPPPPRPHSSQNFQSSKTDPDSVKSSGVSSIDELDDFVMGRPRNNADEHGDVLSSAEDKETNSASAAAMKEAMDRAEAKFKHAREVRERENAKATRSRGVGLQEQDEKAMQDAQDRELREKQERLDREREQRERERAQEIERDREKARQAVERATKEARERAAAEARLKAERAAVEKANSQARERAERAAVQRAQAEARERAAAEARERAERAVAEARERAQAEAAEKVAAVARAEAEARRRAERAAVDRAAAEARERAAADARERAAAAARGNQQKNENDLDSFFNIGVRPNSAPRSRTASSDSAFSAQFNSRTAPEGTQRSSAGTSSSIRKASSTTNIVDDLTSIFGAAPSSGEFQEVEGESEERRRARLVRHQRTQERAAKALADKNERDLQTQRDQAERHRIAETLDVEIKRWAAGKEGNLRALLSTLQYVLWPECGWQPVSLTDLITTASVKKVYRKATLCIHPDKVQQKGANLQQKYIAEKVFDLLKEAWNKLNSEELF